MPRVHHVKAAAKDHGDSIKKGEPYYWWQFRHGPVIKSKTAPKRSQLTQSDKLSRVYAAEEALESAVAAATSVDDIEAALNDCASEAREVADEYREAKDNMPEGLQEGPTGELCENNADELESWADELEAAANEVMSLDLDDYEGEDREQQLLEAAREEASSPSCPI